MEYHTSSMKLMKLLLMYVFCFDFEMMTYFDGILVQKINYCFLIVELYTYTQKTVRNNISFKSS